MSQENVEIVRRFIDQAHDNPDAVWDILDADVEWQLDPAALAIRKAVTRFQSQPIEELRQRGDEPLTPLERLSPPTELWTRCLTLVSRGGVRDRLAGGPVGSSPVRPPLSAR